ncbi:hypothetical protein ABIA33_000260 [Streptacidiphilus sp. MAP12-16]|uniref:LppU/SCO3897 family protein n=1 Tax=Streptacidiphilus sp. MAP12-16 TaxID=3156300 RepID=UPI00351755D1
MSTPPSFETHPGYAAQTPAPQPSKKSGFARRMAIRLGVLVILGGAWFAYDYATGDPTTASAGDCVHNAGTDSKPDVSVLDCKDAKADYKVIKTINGSNMDDCQGLAGLDAAYTQTSSHGDSLVLCLAKNTH